MLNAKDALHISKEWLNAKVKAHQNEIEQCIVTGAKTGKTSVEIMVAGTDVYKVISEWLLGLGYEIFITSTTESTEATYFVISWNAE